MKAVVVQSGGMDSAVLLDSVLQGYEPSEVLSLGFQYGQRHVKELQAGWWYAKWRHVERRVVFLDLCELLKGSSQTDHDVEVPEGHYAEDTMKLTVVPNRNMVMLATAAAVAIGQGAQAVYYGAHAGDHTVYPDCRPSFVSAVNFALLQGNWSDVKIRAPFLNKSKADLVSLGLKLGTDFSQTWTCYRGENIACGRCSTCVERLEAFDEAGHEDPLEYQDRDFWRQAVADFKARQAS